MIISLSTMYRERGIIKTLFFIRNYRKKDFLDTRQLYKKSALDVFLKSLLD